MLLTLYVNSVRCYLYLVQTVAETICTSCTVVNYKTAVCSINIQKSFVKITGCCLTGTTLVPVPKVPCGLKCLKSLCLVPGPISCPVPDIVQCFVTICIVKSAI